MVSEPGADLIYRLGRRAPEELNEDERARFVLVAGQILNLDEALFLQHQQGAIDDDFFQGRFATFHRMIHQPGLRHVWEDGARTYDARSFVRRVEELLATPPDEGPPA